eukprot:scaffold227478_cov22-Prasinocladus_malaysianus.AAC.1
MMMRAYVLVYNSQEQQLAVSTVNYIHTATRSSSACAACASIHKVLTIAPGSRISRREGQPRRLSFTSRWTAMRSTMREWMSSHQCKRTMMETPAPCGQSLLLRSVMHQDWVRCWRYPARHTIVVLYEIGGMREAIVDVADSIKRSEDVCLEGHSVQFTTTTFRSAE